MESYKLRRQETRAHSIVCNTRICNSLLQQTMLDILDKHVSNAARTLRYSQMHELKQTTKHINDDSTSSEQCYTSCA